MITFTRRQAADMCGIIRRLPDSSLPGARPALRCTAGSDGLTVRCRTETAAFEFRQPGRLMPDRVILPLAMLRQIAGRRDDPVTLEQVDNRVIAHWHDGRMREEMRYDLTHDTKSTPTIAEGFDSLEPRSTDLPPLPEQMAENSPRLLTALRDAAETTDRQTTNQQTTDQQTTNRQTPPAAVNCLQLRGGIGALAATDRTQLLVQRGFEFPWRGERLIRSSLLFGCHMLSERSAVSKGHTISIGADDAWVTLRSGPWTVWFAVLGDATYPHLDDILRDPDTAVAGCPLTPDDANILARVITRLPADAAGRAAVTLDLNGVFTVRSQAPDQTVTTELVLSQTNVEGTPLRVHTDRQYLARALRLGLRNFALFGPAAPIVCHDEQRYYIWMVLDAAGIGPGPPHPVRITAQPNAGQPSTPTTSGHNTSIITPQPRPGGSLCGPHSGPIFAAEITTLQQAEVLQQTLMQAAAESRALTLRLRRQQQTQPAPADVVDAPEPAHNDSFTPAGV